MESSKPTQIDTSTKHHQPPQSLDNLTTTDKFILRVMSKTEDIEYHISSYELIKKFKDYEKSLKKFHIYPEEFFY